jgi:cbb3-type cytochrome oxidase maturation protein
MSAIYLLIAASLVVATGFLAAFIWAARSGQYEDTDTPAMRVLFDDEVTPR